MNDAPDTATDVLVIGGGPAGSTISALLARAGHQVVLLEKERHPRFHIGESLLPMNLPILERLGLGQAVADIGLRKLGADFAMPDDQGRWQTFRFERALGDSPGHAWEVRRSEFDQLLFRNAASCGAQTLEEVEVTAATALDDGSHRVTAREASGQERHWHTRYLVDASGRDTFLARRHRWMKRDQQHASAAIFGHFRGVSRRPEPDSGNISLYPFEQGWMWMIPLRGDIMSIGAVCWPEYLKQRQGAGLEDFLRATLARNPEAQSRLQDARLVNDVQVTGNYSYRSSRLVGPGYVLLGDAYAFIDPVFSSGVYLAMNSAEQAVGLVEHWLAGQRAEYRRSARAFKRGTDKGLRRFSWFIHRFNTPAMRQMFRQPRNNLQLEQAMISMLAGDVFHNQRARWRIGAIRLVYWLMSLSSWRDSLADWRQRRRNVRSEFV